MNNEFLEAILYDWHNGIILGHQNKDIIFYKKYICSHHCNNVLIVGAGTGRVAIPMLDYANVDALDISLGRLIRLNEKNHKINIIACDFLNYKTNKKYDLIIFPYSTIQAIDKEYYNILLKIKEILTAKGKCLIDYDSSFSNIVTTKKYLKCNGYCNRIKKNITEYNTINKFEDRIEVLRNFIIDKENFIVNEMWYIFNENRFEKELLKVKMSKSNKYFGYGNNSSTHKIIIEIAR